MIFGLDPGAAGALALLTDAGQLVWARALPRLAGRLDKAALLATLREVPAARVAVELVGSVPTQGRRQSGTSMYTFGFGAGQVDALVFVAGHALVEVRPQDWHALLQGLPRGRVPDAATPEQAARLRARRRKENAVRRATQLWPNLTLPRQQDWGRADACLIAEWARRQVLGLALPQFADEPEPPAPPAKPARQQIVAVITPRLPPRGDGSFPEGYR